MLRTHMFLWIVVICTVGLAEAAERFQFVPSKIKPNDPYEVHIDLPNGTLLDYDLRYSDLGFDILNTDGGAYGSYTVQDGKVLIPGGQNISPGVYMIRFKPRGAPATDYTRFDILLVDELDTINPALDLTSQIIDIPPPPGSYVVFENYQGDTFLGYSRFDYETDPCETGGFTMRMTKTHESCYWNAGGSSFLRWCVDHTHAPQGRYLQATGGTLYKADISGSIANLTANTINVSYENNGWSQAGSQGALGGWPVGEIEELGYYLFDDDMGVHYSLLPVDDCIPANLSGTPLPVVELAFGHYSGTGYDDTFLDTWHDSALVPTMPESVLRMRYIETGAILHGTWIQDRWSVTEDWDWRQDGLVSRVVHWTWNDPPCWRGDYDCDTNATLAADARMVDYYIPDNQPLQIGFKNPVTGEMTTRSRINNGDAYTLSVRLADGRKYHGFLEFQFPDGSTTLWRDKDLKPIYVSHGQVTVGPAAYGTILQLALHFRARPYLANSSVNACAPAPDSSLIPNAGTAAFSNWAGLYVARHPADLNGDTDVDGGDLLDLRACLTGATIPQDGAACRFADLDVDGDVDLDDFGQLQRCYSGTSIPADSACIN